MNGGEGCGRTAHRAVGRPRGDGGAPLVEQDVRRLLAHVVVHNGVDVAVVEAVPLSVNGVLTVGWEGETSTPEQ